MGIGLNGLVTGARGNHPRRNGTLAVECEQASVRLSQRLRVHFWRMSLPKVADVAAFQGNSQSDRRTIITLLQEYPNLPNFFKDMK
jgi:hypothetical protein